MFLPFQSFAFGGVNPIPPFFCFSNFDHQKFDQDLHFLKLTVRPLKIGHRSHFGSSELFPTPHSVLFPISNLHQVTICSRSSLYDEIRKRRTRGSEFTWSRVRRLLWRRLVANKRTWETFQTKWKRHRIRSRFFKFFQNNLWCSRKSTKAKERKTIVWTIISWKFCFECIASTKRSWDLSKP